MEVRLLLLILGIVIGIWGLYRSGVILVFSSFFFLSISIPLRSSGSEASTMLIRYVIFVCFILLQAIKGNGFLFALKSIGRSRFFWGYLAIFLIGVISTAYSTSNYSDKMMSLKDTLIHTLVPMGLYLAYFGDIRDISEFPSYFLTLTIISFFTVIRFLDTSAVVINDRTTIDFMGFGTIFFSRIGVIALISSILTFYYKKNLWYRILSLISAFLSLFLVLISSQRAPIIGFIIAMLVWLQFGVRIQKNLRPIIVVIILLLALLAMNIEQFAVIDRFKDLENYQEYERYSDYGVSLRLFLEKPIFGQGMMGYYDKTGRIYPHNLLLEVMAEYGIFGLFFYAFMLAEIIAVARRTFYKPNANYGLQVVVLSWIAMFTVSFFAGSIRGSNEFLFLSCILSAVKNERYLFGTNMHTQSSMAPTLVKPQHPQASLANINIGKTV